MQNVVQDFRAEPLNKALVNGNSFNTLFVPPGADATSPDPNRTFDGFIIFSGVQGQVSPGRVFLLPYCDAPNSNFSIRLYGWRRCGNPDPSPQTLVWFPTFLAEFLCTSCAIAGPTDNQPGISMRVLKDTEYLCDTITLTQGSLGNKGLITSTGPGTNLVAFSLLDGCGATLLSFDFQQTDPVGMNCFWARA